MPSDLLQRAHRAAASAANSGFEDRHWSKRPVQRDRSNAAADAAVRTVLEGVFERGDGYSPDAQEVARRAWSLLTELDGNDE